MLPESMRSRLAIKHGTTIGSIRWMLSDGKPHAIPEFQRLPRVSQNWISPSLQVLLKGGEVERVGRGVYQGTFRLKPSGYSYPYDEKYLRAASDNGLRKSLIRLAHANHELRPHLLPILKERSSPPAPSTP